jgi:hypothetical protein
MCACVWLGGWSACRRPRRRRWWTWRRSSAPCRSTSSARPSSTTTSGQSVTHSLAHRFTRVHVHVAHRHVPDLVAGPGMRDTHTHTRTHTHTHARTHACVIRRSVTRESPVIKSVYSTLREAEHRSMSFVPYWKLPFADKVLPDQVGTPALARPPACQIRHSRLCRYAYMWLSAQPPQAACW